MRFGIYAKPLFFDEQRRGRSLEVENACHVAHGPGRVQKLAADEKSKISKSWWQDLPSSFFEATFATPPQSYPVVTTPLLSSSVLQADVSVVQLKTEGGKREKSVCGACTALAHLQYLAESFDVAYMSTRINVPHQFHPENLREHCVDHSYCRGGPLL